MRWRRPASSAADLRAIGITNQRETTRPVGPVERPRGGRRDRVAGPPHGRCLRGSAGRPDPRADRPRPRPLLLGHQARLAARARGRLARRPGIRHRGQLADLEADRRRGARHRSHQRLAHHALLAADAWLGRPPAGAVRRAGRPAAGDPAVQRHVRRGPAAGSAAAGDGRGRRPAGGAVRPGLPRARAGQGHLRHRQLPAGERRRAARPAAARPAADGRRAARGDGARGIRVRVRRGRPVAAGRARDPGRRRRQRQAGRLAGRKRRRLLRARPGRARLALVGRRRARADHAASPAAAPAPTWRGRRWRRSPTRCATWWRRSRAGWSPCAPTAARPPTAG